MLEVIHHVYKLSGWWDQADLGSNVYLIVAEGTLTLVDAGFRGKTRQILKRVYELGFSPSRIGHIIVTHHHPDHIGGLAALKDVTRAKVIAHSADAAYIDGRLPQPGPFRPPWLRTVVRPIAGRLKTGPVTVDIQVEDGDELPVAGGIKILHTPGHTPGSICIFLKDRGAVMTGDLLAQRSGVKLPSMPFTRDVEQEFASIKKLAGQEFETACFGHGSPLRKGAGKRVAEFARKLDAGKR
jgi:glyoxylase-like metal-dependent hydrolase (beta-lactamase superfamily II)